VAVWNSWQLNVLYVSVLQRIALRFAAYNVGIWNSGLLYVLQLTVWQFGKAGRF
jgi:hypothetical protein